MKFVLFWLLILFYANAIAQKLLYNPSIDGMQQLHEAINLANKTNKHVLVQVGGNWCPWCIKFHDFCDKVYNVDSIIKASYIHILLNYSRENKNESAMQYLEYPERFGFPVLVILDSNGKRIHTQDSEMLEKLKSYDTSRVIKFLKNWTPEAIKKR